MEFIPINVETCYSFLNSAIKIDDYIDYCSSLNYKFIGICDDNPYAFIDFSKKCFTKDIQPILGCKFVFIYNNQHIEVNIYIKDEIGYKNFCALFSQVKNNVFIGEFNDTHGLICVFPSLKNDIFSNQKLILNLKEKFNDFFIGLECYNESNKFLMQKIIDFSAELNIKTIPFPIIKTIHKNDGLTLKIISSIKNNTSIESLEQLSTPYFILKDSSVNKIYPKESIDNLSYFKNIKFNIISKRGNLLSFDIKNKKEYIFSLCIKGLKEKGITDTKYINRLIYELNIIEQMGYLDYFLIVHQFVNACKNDDIPVGPGRGSAAGALCSFALNITEIDPIKYNLLFERFLNPERVSMPDIDVDFADYKRDEVIKKISSFYGKERVKPIITFQKFLAKQSLKDIGKVFNFNVSDINYLCKSLGNANTFSDAEKNIKFKKILENSYYKTIIDLAKKIEGFPRQKGIHASGIIINNVPLKEVLPISSDENTPVPFEANHLEELGFLKMDILALRNLSIIESIVNKIKTKIPDFSIKNIQLNDQKTFDVLNAGLTKSIFQLESEGITAALKIIHIDSFEDIVCLNALYRPGPMDNIKLYANRKNNCESFEYLNPILEPILKDTNGIIIYQEQIMLIAQKVANFSLGKADILRRAISKKDENKLKSLKDDFINGSINNGFLKDDALLLYEYIYKFANYGFNKSHSVSYSLITYQMAYLKANYPLEFFSTILEAQKQTESKYFDLLNEINYFKIKLINPSINLSTYEYSIENNSLRLPLSEIKDINSNVEKIILQERSKSLFKDFFDFIKRMIKYEINENQFINLIDSGALDEFKFTRSTLKNNLANYLLFFKNFPDIESFSQNELVDLLPVLHESNDDENQKNVLEMQSLGILLSGDLFARYDQFIKENNIQTIYEANNNIGKEISFIAKINSIKEITTKRGEKMGIIICFDNYQQIKVIVFPTNYLKIPILNKLDDIVVKGYLKVDEIGKSFIAKEIIKMEEYNE